VGVVKVKRDGSILEGPATAKDLVEDAIYLGKGDWTACCQAATIVGSFGTKVTEVDGAPGTVSKGIGGEPPGGFDAFGAFHGVLDHEDGAAHRQTAFWVVDPGLHTSRARDELGDGSGHVRFSVTRGLGLCSPHQSSSCISMNSG
jgi:hypothetical protein